MAHALLIIGDYSIGNAARRLRVHPRTLRIYEAEGFLSPFRRGNMRRYAEADLVLVTAVRFLTQERGLNLAGVRILFDLIAAGRLRGIDIDPALRDLENVLPLVGLSESVGRDDL